MSDDFSPEPPKGEPRFRIEADTYEELLEQLRAIAPQDADIRFSAPRRERLRGPEEIEPPERVTHRDLTELADELSARLEENAAYVEVEEPSEFDSSDWHPQPRSEPGDVRRRFQSRRKRQMESEAGYVWLYDAMMARELTDRTLAIRELEQVKDAARLERLAEHSPQRVTRRAALDALAKLKAVPALESAALYVRPELFVPKKPKTEGESTLSRAAPEFHDDTRDHAVDLLAQLADEGVDDALDALKRIVRYDFSKDAGARFRALRRLGEKLDTLESQRDWGGMSMLYRESRNAQIRRRVAERFSHHLPELEEAGEVDALLAVADLHPELRDKAEAAVRRIEGKEPTA